MSTDPESAPPEEPVAENAGQPKPPPLRLWGLAAAAGLIGCVCTLAGFLGGFWWAFDLCAHFRVQYTLGLTVLALILLAGKHRRWAATLGAFALLNLALIAPLWWGRQEPPPDAPRYRLLIANVNSAAGDPAAVAALIAAEDPDLLVLMEVTAGWLTDLAAATAPYPHRQTRPRDDNFGIAVFCRHPLAAAETVDLADQAVPSILATVRLPAGNLRLIATHPLPPGGPEYSAGRNAQLAAVAARAADLPGPLIVAGDLNVTRWSSHFRRLCRRGDLRDSARGFGVQPTWPAGNPLLRIPIDHCLYKGAIGIADRRIGPHTGSDHFPLIVDFALPSE